ncbi:hypothetical protein [Algicella marina]|uniref:Uncharacterized protein n=1 Tax=Algicella marina TaxID=2683284 RepID=A0A6P1T1X5_9RHOB|nr:hypothetical protein [Algicella marina]QHQ36924.1 hypothetical protein GO499_17915 [Algicella marina]
MKLDDRFMTILTALVLFIGVGALLSRGEDGQSLLGGSAKFQPKPDTFQLRAGRLQSLDVLLNDKNKDLVDVSALSIVEPPECGLAEAINGAIQYSDSLDCIDKLEMSYCVPFEGECEATIVTLNVINVDKEKQEAIEMARREAEASGKPLESGGSAPSIMTDMTGQAAAPEQQSPQFAMQRPVRLEIPSTAEVITPTEATESIRNRDVAVAVNVQSTDIANMTDSGVNVSTASARAGNVSMGGISMASPMPGGEESDISIAMADTTPQRNPSRPTAPSGLAASTSMSAPAPQPGTSLAGAPSSPSAPALGGGTPTAPAQQMAAAPTAPSSPSAPSAPTAAPAPAVADIKEAAPAAQTRVADAPEATPQPETPESSGVLASLARSSSFLGVTVSAAKALLSPEEERTVAAVVPTNTTSAPRPKDYSVSDGLGAQAPDIGDLGQVTPLPQADRPVPTGSNAPTLVASLATDDVEALSGLSTPAARPTPEAPKAAEVPTVETPVAEAETVEPEQEVAALTTDEELSTVPAVDPEVAVEEVVKNCGVDMALQVQVGAEIVASIVSPCRPNEQFTVEHSGMAFSANTDAEGMANVIVPALVSDATVKVSFADGAEEEGAISVTNLSKVTRVAVTWDADINFDLHALEFGAQEASEGHVWAEQPKNYREARRSGGGYLLALGPETGPGLRAEVYTLFETSRTQGGLVDLSLKLAEFGQECNDSPVIRTLRTEGLDIERDRDIQFALSGCENASEIVVPNTIRDIRISRR